MRKIINHKILIGVAMLMLAVYMMPSLTLAQEPFLMISDPLTVGSDVNVLGLCPGATTGNIVPISLISSAGTTFLINANVTNNVGNFNEHIIVPAGATGNLSVQAVCPNGLVLITPPAILPGPADNEEGVLGESIPMPTGGVAAGGGGADGMTLVALALALMSLSGILASRQSKIKSDA